jgi:RNA polymerase sigma-70 factor (ECF subfamily)
VISAATAEAVARRSYGKLVALLSARTRDVAAAEDALADAFAAALAAWPAHGVPANPEAWLLTAARHRLIDAARARQTHAAASDTLQLLGEWAQAATDVAGQRHEIPDRRLALMFACAHPAIDAALRAPLMLQTLLGLDAAAIGSAFLVAPATMGQRLVRAKARIRQAGIPFAVPALADLPPRLGAVLDAIYACYAEGWTDPAGTDPQRRNLADEALWLGGLLASLLPDEPEALGLLSLMLHSHARRAARRDAAGHYVPLAAQHTALWDARMLREAERLLHRAGALALAPGAGTGRVGRDPWVAHPRVGRYQLEAAIQSAHSVRRFTGVADWPAIVALYDALARLTDSPVVALNRAVALAETAGPAAGLAALDALAADARLADYQPAWAARADLLQRLGRGTEATAAYDRAIGLEADPVVRAFLQQRRRQAGPGQPPGGSG